MVDSARRLQISGLFLLLSACSTLPHFEDMVYGRRLVRPTVNDITHEVQCELLGALSKGQKYKAETASAQLKDKDNQPFGALPNYIWTVNVDLTLDVTDDEGLNPSLSYIDPLNVADTNFTATLAPQFSEEQHRNINVQFTQYLDPTTPTTGACDATQNRAAGLRGNLGVEQIIATGLPYAVGQPDPSFEPSPYIMKTVGVELTGATSGTPVFGSTIDFSIVYGLGGTPTWTLAHFAGPGGSSGSLLSAMRTHKDTLTLSFAQSAGTSAESISAAAKAAQDNATRMILHRLLP